MTKLVESLRGDALQIAVDIGVEALTKEDRSGLKSLTEKITSHVFPIMKDEVKALYKEGQREGGGILSRQRGEPMKHYLTRRDHWLAALRKLDDKVQFTDDILG